jgi:hypothetical protein
LSIYRDIVEILAEPNKKPDTARHGAEDDVEQHLEEELPVLEAHAIIDPRTVVVHVEYASITRRAVVASLRLEDMAYQAEAPFLLVRVIQKEAPRLVAFTPYQLEGTLPGSVSMVLKRHHTIMKVATVNASMYASLIAEPQHHQKQHYFGTSPDTRR